MIYRIIGTFLVVLSGFALFADLIFSYFGIEFKNTYGFSSSENFVYVVGLLSSVILITIGSNLKPFVLAYLIPVYCVFLSFYWILFLGFSDKEIFNLYVLLASLVVLILVAFISIKAKNHFKKEKELELKSSLLEKVLDLSILTLKKEEEQNGSR